jgi:nucleoid-associated protein YgaU
MLRDPFRRGAASARTELPPYYARRLDAVGAPSRQSVRREALTADPEAEARRIFRDFKLGLLTLVVIALVLVAYFWEGGAGDREDAPEAEEGVLSFTIPCRPRGEVLPLAPVREERVGRAPLPQGPPRRVRAVRSPQAPPARRGSAGLASGSVPGSGARRSPAVGAAPWGWVYSVKPGDTLSAIALRFYGDAAEWKVILEANLSRIRRPSDLRAGMRILIPARPREARRRTRASSSLARAAAVWGP